MSTLRISNIEAKADNSSPTVDEQLYVKNSTGDLMLYLDGRTSGITTVGINTTNQTIKFDANNNVLVTGIITATKFSGPYEGLSVVTDDWITHQGDTNTRMGFPAADTFAVETGGGERLRIASDGKIGINEASPQRQLHVHDDTIYKGIFVNGSAAPRIAFARDTTTTGEWSVGIDGTNGTQFAINNSDGNSNRKVIISSSQISLLSNTSVTGELSISSHIRPSGAIYLPQEIAHTGDTDTNITFPANDTIAFDTAGDERLRIKSDGNIGIGENNPTSLLHVSGGSSPTILNKPSDATPAIFVGDSNRSGSGQHLAEFRGNWNGTLVSRMVFSSGDDTSNKDNGNIDFYTAAAGTTALAVRIFSDGDVGIGTHIMPGDSKLHLWDSSTTNYRPIVIDSAATNGSVLEYKQLGTNVIRIGSGGANNLSGSNVTHGLIRTEVATVFAVGNSEKVRITSGGELLVGTTSRIQTYSSSGGTLISSYNAGANGGGIELGGNTNSDGFNAGSIFFVNNTNSDAANLGNAGSKIVGMIRAEIETSDSNAGDDSGADLTFLTKPEAGGGSERLRITSTGELKQYGFAGSTDTSADDLVLGNTTGGVNRGMTIWSNNSQNGSIAFADNDSNFRAAVQYLHGDDEMRFVVTGEEKYRITSHATYINPTTHGDSVNTKAAARWYTLSGATPLDGTNTNATWTPLMRCGHSFNGTMYLWMAFNGSEFHNGCRQQIIDCQGTYGYNSFEDESVHYQNALGAGLNSMDFSYQNSGSPNYYFKVRGTWASGQNTPYILWTWVGSNSEYPYAL